MEETNNHQKVLLCRKLAIKDLKQRVFGLSKKEGTMLLRVYHSLQKDCGGGYDKSRIDGEEKAYYFDEFIEMSGNSSIRTYFWDQHAIDSIRNKLGVFGCESEAFLARKIVAMNIPKKVDYTPVKDYLEKGEHEDKWEYEEACLSHQY